MEEGLFLQTQLFLSVSPLIPATELMFLLVLLIVLT